MTTPSAQPRRRAILIAALALAAFATQADANQTEVVTIPVGKTVVWVAPPVQGPAISRGFHDRDAYVTWRGQTDDFSWSASRECITKWVIVSASMRVTVQWTANLCGRVPRIEISAAGATHPLNVGVTQTYKVGPAPPPEPEETAVEASTDIDPNLLSCTYDGQPIDVELAPGATLLGLQRAIVGPVTP